MFVCLLDAPRQRRQLKSDMWKYFTKESRDKGKCLYCKCEISIRYGSVSNLRRHLIKKHPLVYPEKNNKHDYAESESQSHFTAEERVDFIKVEEVSSNKIILFDLYFY